jgi:hypothetical protein
MDLKLIGLEDVLSMADTVVLPDNDQRAALLHVIHNVTGVYLSLYDPCVLHAECTWGLQTHSGQFTKSASASQEGLCSKQLVS